MQVIAFITRILQISLWIPPLNNTQHVPLLSFFIKEETLSIPLCGTDHAITLTVTEKEQQNLHLLFPCQVISGRKEEQKGNNLLSRQSHSTTSTTDTKCSKNNPIAWYVRRNPWWSALHRPLALPRRSFFEPFVRKVESLKAIPVTRKNQQNPGKRHINQGCY